MILVVAATQMEMNALTAYSEILGAKTNTLVCGVGPVEAAVRIGRYLCQQRNPVSLVVNFGIGGAYLRRQSQANMLDVCLATSEVLGDFGICLGEQMEYFSEQMVGLYRLALDEGWLETARKILEKHGHSVCCGDFVTVNSVSGSAVRGSVMAEAWNGLCENMEGAALARVLAEYRIPLIECRVISNMVVDRDRAAWEMEKACAKAGTVASLLVTELSSYV